MSDYCTERQMGLARKRHWCFLCCNPIEPGESQTYWTSFHDGTHDDIHVHPECLALLENYCKNGCCNSPGMCDGMSPDCLSAALTDVICKDCPDRRFDYRDRCVVERCNKVREEMKRIGRDILEKRVRRDAADIVREVMSNIGPLNIPSFTDKEIRELVEKPLAKFNFSLDKVEFEGDNVHILVSKELPTMIDVTVKVEK